MTGLVYLKNVVTLQIIEEKCNGCGMCINVCPHEVFELYIGKSHIVNRDQCMECGACSMNCREKAISVKSGVGCAAGILNGIIKNSDPTCGCSDKKSVCC